MRDLAVRQVYSHEVRAQDPGRDRLMMSGQNGSRQIIEAILAGLAQVSLSVPLAIVMAIADHSCAAAVEADNAVRPAELTNDFIALRLVEQGRQLDQVHHGSRSLPHRERPTDQLPDQDQHPEILPRAGGSLPARSPSPRNPTRANPCLLTRYHFLQHVTKHRRLDFVGFNENVAYQSYQVIMTQSGRGASKFQER